MNHDFSHIIYLESAWLCYIWVIESTTWMHMLFCTVLAQWIHLSARLPEFFDPTFPWNHTNVI